MNKKTITLVMMLLLAVVGAKADVIPSSYYSEPSVGTYYIYNVTEGKFLRTVGVSENNYSLLDAPVAVTLTAKGETICKGGGDYILSGNTDNFIKIGNWGGQWLWSNAASGNADILAWTFNSNGTKTYTMSITLSEAFSQNGGTLNAGTYYMKDVTNLGSEAEAGTYALITEANYEAYQYNTLASTASISATYFTTTPAAGTYYLYSPYASCFLYATSDHAGFQNTPAAVTLVDDGDNFYIQFSNDKYLKYADAGKWGNTWANGESGEDWAFSSFHGATGLFFIKHVTANSYLYAKNSSADTWGGECWGTAETGNTRYAWALISATDYANWQNSFVLDEATGYSATKDIYNVNPTINRAMTANVWNTLVVPFDMAIPSGWTVKEPTAFDGSTLTFGDASSIVAGKPYIVKPTEAVTSFSATGVTLKKDLVNTTVGTGTTVTMRGTYEKMDAIDYASQNSYVVGIKDGVSSLYKVTSTVSLKPFRAYFTVEGGVGARINIAFDDDETTGISSMYNEQCTMNNEVYDLQGRHIANPAKGLYIVNGKKVVLK